MKPESSAALWLKFFTSAGISIEYAEHYAVTFSKNQIQMDMLPEINKHYLNDMGISLLGHVIAILRHAKLVYADEIKKMELSAPKKANTVAPVAKTNKENPGPSKQPAQTTKPLAKTTKPLEVHKPTSAPVKRKSAEVGSSSVETSEPKTKVRKNLCDSSDDIRTPKSTVQPKPKPKTAAVKENPIAKITNPPLVTSGPSISEDTRKGIFTRLGNEPSNSTVGEAAVTQSNSSNGVFSRLGGKIDSPQITVKLTPLPFKKVTDKPQTEKPILKPIVKPSSKKSIIRTRLDKPNKPKCIIPSAYMDQEDTVRPVNTRVSFNGKFDVPTHKDKTDIKSRLGLSSDKAFRGNGGKKVSFGTVSQKLIPRVAPTCNNTFGSKTVFNPLASITSQMSSRAEAGVFTRLGRVPQFTNI